MERAAGLAPVTAAEQLQVDAPQGDTQPLPEGNPGRAKAADVGIEDPGEGVSFLVIGDHGGVKAPGPQNAVSYAMQSAAGPAPAFVYTVGDIVYFYGEEWEYPHQFYEPYAHLLHPIVGIPGNHDGDHKGKTTERKPLDGFMANFCDKTPSIPPSDPHFEFGRHTQTQPYCDWTLELDAVTMIGLYSNVTSHGHFEPSQTEWLTGELKDAAAGKPVIVSLHHPPYSVDSMHGGSERMGAALDKAFDESGRTASLVLSGHVHDYQRFTRKRGDEEIPYIVVGNSGYHNLHRFAKGSTPGEEIGGGVTFEYGDDGEYGFLELTVSDGRISGSYTGVKPGTMPDGSDMTATPGKDTFTL
ncbi:MAG TPA: metallophosphoesterase [Solirubrobacterales bacterium]|nr:metallophosphoesterase [Solirubrobacterales bacterium]